MQPASAVLVEKSNGLAVVTFNRPEKRNSMSIELLTDFLSALAELKEDDSTHVIILTGKGPAFCAGADLSALKGVQDEAERQRVFARSRKLRGRLSHRTYRAVEGMQQITIAAVSGPCVGGGWAIANSCDFRIAAEDARFWFPEVDLGSPVGASPAARLVRMIGLEKAKEVVLTCRRYTAREIFDMGMVFKVTPKDKLIEEAHALARTLLSKRPAALSLAKAILNNAAGYRNLEAITVDADLFLGE